jgi:tRNA(Arg) A34 adenosine deaminase TadA
MLVENLMQLAIDKARQGIAAGQSPFGCAIAIGDTLLAVAHNTVLATVDVSAHAEINALRLACHTAQHVHLTGAVVASTCEPCPMCIAALHWARVAGVFFGASISDAASAGFNELNVPAGRLLALGGSPIRVTGGVLEQQCRQLFAEWQQRPDRIAY